MPSRIHGACGYSKETEIERLYRDAGGSSARRQARRRGHQRCPDGRVSRTNRLAVRPPSTMRFVPVMAEASSEARKAQAAATSSGRTRRRSGTRAKSDRRRASSSSDQPLRSMWVSV